MKNKYVKRGKISEAKFRRIVYLFSLDLTAVQISDIANLNRNTVNRYLKGIRQRVAEYCEAASPPPCKLHDSKHEGSEYIVGLVCREQSIHLGMFNARRLDTSSLSSDKIVEANQLSSLGQSFDALYDPREQWKMYIKNSTQSTHSLREAMNRIDGFIGFSRSRLQKFKGLQTNTLYLHLKECEFRYNQQKDEYYHLLLKIVRNNPLF